MSDQYGRNPELNPDEQPTERYQASPGEGYPTNPDQEPYIAPTTPSEPPLEQPTQAQPTYEQPVYEQPVYEQPVYEQPVYVQPTYDSQLPEEQPTQVTPNYTPPYTNPPYTNQQSYDQPTQVTPEYSQPNYNQQDYNQPSATYSQPSESYTAVTTTQGGSNVGAIVAVVIGLLLILGLASFFIFFNKPSNNIVAVAATPTTGAPTVAAQPSSTLAQLNSPTPQEIPTSALPSATKGVVNVAVPPIVATPMARPTPSPGPVLIDVDKGVASKEMVITTERGEIVADLYPNAAPNSVAVYENMANSGLYDNHTFHRVEDWVLQGNDPKGDGTGGGSITTELNKIPYKIGSVGIARAELEYSNDSQFFIVKTADLATYQNFTFLNTTFDASGKPDSGYTLIGQVTKGMDLVDSMQIGDKIIAVRIHDKEGVAQPTAIIQPTPVPATAEQTTAAQLLSEAAANMSKLTSYSYADSSIISDTGTVDTYVLSGASDLTKQSSEYTLLHTANGSNGNNSLSYKIIQLDGKEYYSTDSGVSWQVAENELLASLNYYFDKVSTGMPSDPASFANEITIVGDESGDGGVKLRHFSVDATKLYGSNAVGIDGPIDFWVDPSAKLVYQMRLRGNASGSTAQISYQGKWSKFNTSALNLTAPSTITTPSAATPTALADKTTPVLTPAGSNTQLAQMLIDAATTMQGFKSFHYTDNSITPQGNYELNGDVDVVANSSSFHYNSAGTVFEVIAIGSREYFSADGGKTWQVNTNEPILGSVNYYLKPIWGDIAKQEATKLAPSVTQSGSENVNGQSTIHISVPAETVYGSNTGGLQGVMEFWISPSDKTVRQLRVSGDYSGSKVDYRANWSDFNKSVNITAPTLADGDNGGNSGLKLTSFDTVKSYHFTYTETFTAEKSVSSIHYDGDIVRTDKAHVTVVNQRNDSSSTTEYIVVGDRAYSRATASDAWKSSSDGKKLYDSYEKLITDQTNNLSALLDSMTAAGDETIAGEPCTHYQYRSGAGLNLNIDLWIAKSDQRVRQLRNFNPSDDLTITLSNLDKVSDITAPAGIK